MTSWRTRIELSLFAASTLACQPRKAAPAAPTGFERPDGDVIVMLPSGGSQDAQPRGDAAPDGATSAGPNIDGTIAEDEWFGASTYTSDVAGSGAFRGDTLSRMRVMRTSDRLAFAIEGTRASGNALLVYVDVDFGRGTGVFLMPNALVDLDGPLDSMLSQSFFGPADLGIDVAFGAVGNLFGAGPGTATHGWRDVSRPGGFTPIAAATLTSCGTDGCETSIALESIGARGSIALFARTANAGGPSNLALPSDPGTPDYVTQFILIPEP